MKKAFAAVQKYVKQNTLTRMKIENIMLYAVQGGDGAAWLWMMMEYA